MEGVKNTIDQGGYQKVVFEKITETYAGGVTLTNTGDGTDIIPAGTPVSYPDPTSGLSTIVTRSSGSDAGAGATLSGTVLGYTQSDTVKDKNPMVGVVVAGIMRGANAAAGSSTGPASYPLSFMKAQPKVTIV